jgi:hypothetical protein
MAGSILSRLQIAQFRGVEKIRDLYIVICQTAPWQT